MSLSNAIIRGTLTHVAQLIDAGANINELDEYGYTPLIETAIMNKPDMAQLLLTAKVDVDNTDLIGRTALHWAVGNNNEPLCQLLLAHQANPNAYTLGGESVLVQPLLRNQIELKHLLYRHGAKLPFAQDFINAKLLAHRFELHGFIELLTAEKRIIDLDLEGFFLESTLGIMENSLSRYINHYASRHLRQYFDDIKSVIHALRNASQLIKYQHYMIDIAQYSVEIDQLLRHDPLILPIGYQGHAITLIHSGNIFIKCDRGEASQRHGSVVIYKMQKPYALTTGFIKKLLYKKQDKQFIEEGLVEYLGLVPISHLPLPAQIIGNCSWANVEATLPAMIFMQLLHKTPKEERQDIRHLKETALFIHKEWMRWDQDTALHECMHSFYSASPARKATKVALLTAILFQRCHHAVNRDLRRAEKIFKIIALPEYNYVLKSYVDVYAKRARTPAGKNLMALIDLCGVHL